MKKQIACLLLLITSAKVFAQSVSYFVDNINGNDHNIGTSRNTAWKSLAKLNSLTFNPGDHIYLKRGQTFDGDLRLKGSGTKRNTIKLSSFGTGRRPIINGGNGQYAIELLDGEFWEIENMETKGGKSAGIFIGCTKDELELEHIRVTNCYVHNIGDTSKLDWAYSKSTGGIIVVNGTIDPDGKPVFYNSTFNDVIVNDCTVRYNHCWTCFSISSGKKAGKGGNANYIRNCVAEYSAADGIRMNGVRNSYIEYCVMFQNGGWPKSGGKNLGGLGAWFFDAEHCTIQFCEAGFVRGATTDAGAFDIDYWQKNSIVQYCYGHDCAGYGVSVFGADSSFPTENPTVRFNIFSNNGRDGAFAWEGDFFVFTWNGGLLNGVNIHHNVSYWNPILHAPSLKFDADFTGNNPNTFRNNIILSQRSILDSLKNTSLRCDSNMYWASDSTPAWQIAKDKYFSLQDWQKATGQDLHSNYSLFKETVPWWHKYPFPAKPFRKNRADEIPPGTKAPSFSTYTTNKQKIRLDSYRQSLILLGFIKTDDSSDKTRSQLAFLKSMKVQYADRKLEVILINESSVINSNTLSKEVLSNFIKDHELEDIPMINDNGNLNIAAKYNVTRLPSVFLISKEGIIKQKWENLTLPAQLALTIEDTLTRQP